MIEIVNGIIIITLIIIVYKYFEKASYDVVMVKSNVNGKEYLVRNLEDRQQAADLMGSVEVKLRKLVEIIETMGYEEIYSKYMQSDVIKETSGGGNSKKDLIEGQNEEGSSEQKNLEHKIKMKLKGDIERLVKNFSATQFSENSPDSIHTSYTINKQNMVFCIRDKKKNEPLVKENIFLYVGIHELSHTACAEIGHVIQFWEIFRIFLRVAIDNGIYKNIDFNSSPQEYCGINISDNPLK